MVTNREIALSDYRTAKTAAHEANLAATPRALLPYVTKAGGVPFPFDRVDMLSANPREQLNQPYKNSVWVMRAIKKIAGPIAAVPLEPLDALSLAPINDPALLAFLAAPVKGLDPIDFAEAAVGWLKLAGECFLIGDDTWLTPFARKRSQLIMPRPDQMRHVVDGTELIGWEYRDFRGGRHLLLPDQVWHKKNWNPYDPWRGLSEFEAARIAAEGDYYAGEFVRNMMANNGDQGVYIIAKGGIPTDPQRAQIIADLREKRVRAQRGEFRAVFLTGDIEVQDPKISAPDANLVANRLMSRHEVFIAFGVPPSMADVQASYSIGSASDRYMLIEETCMPNGKKIAALLAGPASRFTGRPVMLQHDWDEHSTMQAVRRERLDAGKKLWDSGMSWKDVNDYLHLGMQPFTGWDIPYIPFSLQVVGSAAPAVDPAQADDFSENSVEMMMRSLERRAIGLDPKTSPIAAAPDEFRIFACCAHGAAESKTPICRAKRDPKKIALWKAHAAKRRTTIKQFESRIGRELMIARGETLRKIALHASSIDAAAGKSVAKAAAADLVFDQQSFADRFLAAMRKAGRIALDTAGGQLFEEVGRDDPFKFPPEAVLTYLRKRDQELSDVPEEITQQIRNSLDEGLTDGDTAKQLAARVKAVFNDISDGRARTIASTETSAAYGAGRNEAMVQAGVQFKAWLTSGNDNVRDAHLQAGEDYSPENAIPINEAYVVDGEELMFPGDSDGSAGNVINCHCISIAVAAPKEGE